MKRKDIRFSVSEGAVDPLVWLKSELLREGLEDNLTGDLVNELEALALRLRESAALRPAPSDDAALDICPDGATTLAVGSRLAPVRGAKAPGEAG